MMSGFKLPSEYVRESDRHRGHTLYVVVWSCRDCGETYDALPKVRGRIQCPACGAGEDFIVKRRVKD
jgi:predicted Zn-ribbon and HTH transcriptional regulator